MLDDDDGFDDPPKAEGSFDPTQPQAVLDWARNVAADPRHESNAKREADKFVASWLARNSRVAEGVQGVLDAEQPDDIDQ